MLQELGRVPREKERVGAERRRETERERERERKKRLKVLRSLGSDLAYGFLCIL